MGEIPFFTNQAENEAETLFRDPRGHITKVNCIKLKFVDPVVRSIFIFLKKDLWLVFHHFFLQFPKKKFLLILWPNSIAWLLLILETLGNMCIGIITFPVDDVINLKLTLAFLSIPFPTWPEQSGQEF